MTSGAARAVRRVTHLATALALAMVATLVGAVTPASATTGATAEGQYLFGSATTAYTTNADPVHGQAFKIVGQVFYLLGDTPVPMPQMVVTLERRWEGSTSWEAVGTVETANTTLPNGEEHAMYTVELTAVRTAYYRARYVPESTAIAPSTSDAAEAPVVVRVHRKMPIRLVRMRDNRLALAGAVRPSYGGQRVTVLRKTCLRCNWKRFAVRRTDARGRYRVPLSSPRRGSHFFVTRARASQGLAVTFSQVARIRAR